MPTTTNDADLSPETLQQLADGLVMFNGLDGATGRSLTADVTLAELGQHVTAQKPDWRQLEDSDKRNNQTKAGPVLGYAGDDPQDLAETGWGLVFAANEDPKLVDAILAQLQPLIAHRCETEKAGERYKTLRGAQGIQPGETALDYLTRLSVGPGPAMPGALPYYLLLVGDPTRIPFRFQYELDVQYAVGRLYFDDLEAYGRYARNVVAAETGKVSPRPKEAAFFGVWNPLNAETELSAKLLVRKLADDIAASAQTKAPDWQVKSILFEQATRDRLLSLLGRAETPALAFTASHGLIFPPDAGAHAATDLGALLCGGIALPPGRPSQAIPEAYYVAGRHISDACDLRGLISFHFACFSAGIPAEDDYASFGRPSAIPLTGPARLSPLPQRMLGHEKGSLAFVGHIERALPSSFRWKGGAPQLAVFRRALWLLMSGCRLGYAIEYLNERYADLAAMLLQKLQFWPDVFADKADVAELWLSSNDARNYVVVGDPAVRLAVSEGTKPLHEVMTHGELPKVKFRAGTLSLAGAGQGTTQVEDKGSGELVVRTLVVADFGNLNAGQVKAVTHIDGAGHVDMYLPAELTDADAPYVAMHRAAVAEILTQRAKR